MAKNHNGNTTKNRPAAKSFRDSNPELTSAISPLVWTLGTIGLLAAAGSSAMLVYQHLTGLAIPGCGAGSPCAELANSVWGRVPGTWFSVSSLGLAFFTALLIGWMMSRGGVSNQFRWIARVGVLASIMFLVVMVMKQQLCRYCLAAHVGNLLFYAAMEFGARQSVSLLRPVVAAIAMFALGTLVLGGVEWKQRADVRAKEEAELVESTGKMLAASEKTEQPSVPPVVPTPTTAPATQPRGFTGRYREGPENAPIRIVVFSDYQCADCRNIEMQAKDAVAAKKNVSLSAKQFPLNMDCNPALGSTMHANACWAARAAETAGILRGNDGFWVMHHWLFERGGGFTDVELDAWLRELGYDLSEFKQTMQSEEVARRIKGDADEAQSYGVMYTPMVFINGVELRGYRAPQALTRAIDLLSASNPKPGSPQDDHPPLVVQKYIDDWRFQTRAPMPQAARFWPANATDPMSAPVRIDVFGDYQEPNTAELDPIIRKLYETNPDVTYVFHSFPFDQACNSVVSRTGNPKGCRAARAAHAAGVLGGDAALWKMHAWLMANRERFSDDTLRAAAPGLGLDPDALIATIDGPVVAAALARDLAAAKALNVTQLPMLFINGRFVPRWKVVDQSVLPQLIEEARK
jgi:protein-disulfide isomerase/uncharacterized membrane protein